MIYRMIDLPANVIGFKASWQVTEKDCEEVLSPNVNNHVEKSGQLNCLIVLHDLNKNFKSSAMRSLNKLKSWHNKLKKVAVVGDANSAKKFLETVGEEAPYECKGFSHEELNEAISWAAN